MKIIFFIDSLRPGGKERRMIELAKAFKATQDTHIELVIMNKNLHYKEVLNMNVPIHYIIRSVKKDASVFRKLYLICKKIKPDFIHCWDGMTAIYALPVAFLLKIKLINGMITDAPQKRSMFKKSLFRARLTFPASSLIIANSYAGLKAYNAPTQKSLCIHNGFNFDRTKNIVSNDDIREQLNIHTRYVVGMVASFANVKDYPSYFKAAHTILEKRNDVTFLAIGDKTDSAQAINLVQKGYEKNFRLLGTLADIESYINAMDICVLSTFSEGISNAILEYMASCKPVVATEGGGTNEIVVDGETGFLIAPSSPAIMAEKINTLLNDELLRNSFGQAGRRRIEQEFSIKKMADEYIKAYRGILENKQD